MKIRCVSRHLTSQSTGQLTAAGDLHVRHKILGRRNLSLNLEFLQRIPLLSEFAITAIYL